ncbi:DUF4145 domain-containing protein [Microbacterium sp. C5A9]|uniref:DUF4145 domain-containing protein n=1 Tax=Microbacterium sp. C5A9 TaxID=2736663 RepID=UPI001F51DB92|nr:DUF4145 domain-containing protein [Microbacterium sp. C5A9]MCI1018189.1 DUF4145 domain-containing protein [Microbacterium sp. C5A9]
MPIPPRSTTHSVVDDSIITCPRCDVRAQQVWSWVLLSKDEFADERVELFSDEAEVSRSFDEDSLRMVMSEWRAAHCQGCDQKTLWRDGVNVYPQAVSAPAPHPDMTADVRDVYEEARRVLPISRRAGAALARAALEKQVKLLDPDPPKNSRLDDLIARLTSKVSTGLSERLDIIRHVGNKALHGVDDSDELVVLYLEDSQGADEIAELLFDAINDLIDELVTRPARTRDAWGKLPEGVREAIEKKRQNPRTGDS